MSHFLPSTPTLKTTAALTAAFAAGATASHLYIRSTRQRPPAPPLPLPSTALLAAVELGGTSCRAAVAHADAPTIVLDDMEIPTTDPHATVAALVRFLRRHAPFAALGVASFGPLDLDRASATYGHVTTTGKPGWAGFDLLAAFAEFRVPLGFDTDVNAPALAEMRHGAYADGDSCAYVTVGTGIGVGLVVNGAPVHGLVHPEGGHIMCLRKEGDEYEGWLEVHRLSVESMASARACADRMGVEAKRLADVDDSHPAWDDVAYYLAQLCISITYLTSPHVIVLSGGVMKRGVLFGKIRRCFKELNQGYIAADKIMNQLDKYIVPSEFGDQAGIIGAIELARRAVEGTN